MAASIVAIIAKPFGFLRPSILLAPHGTTAWPIPNFRPVPRIFVAKFTARLQIPDGRPTLSTGSEPIPIDQITLGQLPHDRGPIPVATFRV